MHTVWAKVSAMKLAVKLMSALVSAVSGPWPLRRCAMTSLAALNRAMTMIDDVFAPMALHVDTLDQRIAHALRKSHRAELGTQHSRG